MKHIKQEPDLLWKMPKEIVDFLYHNGSVVDDKYLYYPFWIEVVDRERGHVKTHSMENLPKELKETVMRPRNKSYEGVPRLHGHYTYSEGWIYKCEHGIKKAEEIPHFRDNKEDIIKAFKELNPEFKEDEH